MQYFIVLESCFIIYVPPDGAAAQNEAPVLIRMLQLFIGLSLVEPLRLFFILFILVSFLHPVALFVNFNTFLFYWHQQTWMFTHECAIEHS